MRATVERETMALKATVDPILMKDSIKVYKYENKIEFTGILRVEWTLYRFAF